MRIDSRTTAAGSIALTYNGFYCCLHFLGFGLAGRPIFPLKIERGSKDGGIHNIKLYIRTSGDI
ncbi:hypothetical protein BJ878DRAFT_468953 [Calycina marina]|uniref:Uncharacterized protein n=1 Tax=Calycina marina TaxID=1763456 RepID=A0A9P7YUM1_9HELO|nr:hypothetical protein BJ878DRAFT_468953 [Calycina marina]